MEFRISLITNFFRQHGSNPTSLLMQIHLILGTLWALPYNLSDSILVEAKHITGEKAHLRVKRNSFQFANMVSCVTTKNSFDYADYGCYCGLGGFGQPKDGIDWCCYEHDLCWARVMENPECSGLSSSYAIIYDWGCSPTGSAHCYGPENTCGRETCECDRISSECFASHPYNQQYYDLDPYLYCNTTFVDTRTQSTETANHAATPLATPLLIIIATALVLAVTSRNSHSLLQLVS